MNDTSTTQIYTLSLHDALPISSRTGCRPSCMPTPSSSWRRDAWSSRERIPSSWPRTASTPASGSASVKRRSEEHTSELQSQFHLVCRLLLEKKNQLTQKLLKNI